MEDNVEQINENNTVKKRKKKKSRLSVIAVTELFVILILAAFCALILSQKSTTGESKAKYVTADVIGAGINEEGHIIIAFQNGKITDMGKADLSFVDRGKIERVYLSDDGCVIVVYNDGSETNLGIPENKSEETEEETGLFRVTFFDIDGEIIEICDVKSGESATAPSAPEVEGKIFEKWDTEFDSVTADIDVKPIYKEKNAETDAETETITHKVVFTDGNGNIISEQTVNDGEAATEPEHPTADGKTFSNWDADFTSVTADITVNAVYTATETEKFTVTFLDKDGNVLKTQTIKKGKTAKAPTPPAVDGMIFLKWSKKYTNVKKDIVTTAVYTYDKENVFEFIKTETEGNTSVSLNTAGIVSFNSFTMKITLDEGATVSDIKAADGFTAVKSGNVITVSFSSETNYTSVANICTFNISGDFTAAIESITSTDGDANCIVMNN